MDPDNQQSQQPVSPYSIQQQVSLSSSPRSPLPKILLSVSVILIVLGLMGGAYYLGTQQTINVVYNKKTIISTDPTRAVIAVPTNTEIPTTNPSSSMFSCVNDSDCMLQDKNYSDATPHCCLDYSSPDVIAFNGSWYSQYKTANPVKGVCNMMCTYNPNFTRYSAKCINNTCKKIIGNP